MRERVFLMRSLTESWYTGSRVAIVIAHLHPVVMIELLSGVLTNRYIFPPSDAPCIRPTYRKAMNSSLSEVTVATAGNLIILPSTRTLMQREKTVRFVSQNEMGNTIRYYKKSRSNWNTTNGT